MVVRLMSADAFVVLIKELDYNIPVILERCNAALSMDVAMYLIAPEGMNIDQLREYPWRPNGIFFYRFPSEITRIWQMIRQDLKYIKEVGK